MKRFLLLGLVLLTVVFAGLANAAEKQLSFGDCMTLPGGAPVCWGYFVRFEGSATRLDVTGHDSTRRLLVKPVQTAAGLELVFVAKAAGDVGGTFKKGSVLAVVVPEGLRVEALDESLTGSVVPKLD